MKITVGARPPCSYGFLKFVINSMAEKKTILKVYNRIIEGSASRWSLLV